MKNMISIFMKLLIIMPGILLVVTVILLVNGNNKLKHCDECIGTIVRFYENTSEARVGAYENKAISPVVSYIVKGKNYEFIGNYYSTSMRVGMKVSVLYDKDNAAKAAIKTGIYFAPIITGALTLLFIIPVVIYLVLKSKGIINL